MLADVTYHCILHTQGGCDIPYPMVHIILVPLPGGCTCVLCVCMPCKVHLIMLFLSQEAECMRQVLEPVLYAAGVDLVFNGYVALSPRLFIPQHVSSANNSISGMFTRTSAVNLCTTTRWTTAAQFTSPLAMVAMWKHWQSHLLIRLGFATPVMQPRRPHRTSHKNVRPTGVPMAPTAPPASQHSLHSVSPVLAMVCSRCTMQQQPHGSGTTTRCVMVCT